MNRLISLLLLACILFVGCHSGQQTVSQPATSPSFKVYKLRGKVVSTNPTTGEVTLDHEAIPGFMEAMTMPYKLKDANILSELHPGDRITADLLVSQNPDADVLLDHIVIIAQARADYLPTQQFHVPTAGDIVPDFKLTNQDGKLINLSEFRGNAVLITFIYTRCILPNFCPRVTRNFASIEKQLTSDPALLNKTHLISASFDPDYDTPARLRSYAAAYIGNDTKAALSHWDFSSADKNELDEMARFFNVGLTNEADSTITHTLSTTLIDPDGKVVRFYPGNEWTAEQITADLHHLLQK